MILLDTHVAIWVTTEDPSLGRQCRTLLERMRHTDRLAVSAISFWEMAMLIGKGRLSALTSPAQHRTKMGAYDIGEIPVTGDIAILAAELNLHGDPADRIIAATAIAHEATLVTADRALLRWRHSLPRQNAAK